MREYLAKPNTMNSFGAKPFRSLFEARDYLNEVTETEIKIPVDEWIALGKIVEVKDNGETKIPEYYPKIRKGEMIMIKFNYKDYE
jgi:hypothetical protein